MSAFELPTHRVTITGPDPHRLTVTLDGQELRTCTRAVLTVDADTVPRVDLSLIVLNDLVTDLPAHVILDAPTRSALTAMGWTPPAADQPMQLRAGTET